MFKKYPGNPQTDLLSSVNQHLDSRREQVLSDPNSWHNTFYNEIFVHIDESIFEPIYHQSMGAPNAPVNQLVAMIMIKDAMGYSDQQLFEAFRFNLLYRKAIGCVNLTDTVPTESTYYKFRSQLAAYQQTHQVDLFGQVFTKITAAQVLRFNLSGEQVRMDSKLIGSNIADYSRFELVYATLMKFYGGLDEQAQARMPERVASRMQELAQKDAQSMVYQSSSDQIKEKLGELGRLAHRLLDCYSRDENEHYKLLERMFGEQFTLEATQGEEADQDNIVARPAGEVSADSLQSPHDPDCSYRCKAGEQTKGYSLNVTETIQECEDEDEDQDQDQLNLITDIQLEGAHHGDTDFVEASISATEQLTGDQVETCYADGAYNRSLAREEDKELDHVEMVLSGIQGPSSRFDLRRIQRYMENQGNDALPQAG